MMNILIAGYFRISSTLQCAKCSPCYKDYPGFQYHIEPECQRRMPSGSENICAPVLDVPLRPKTTTRSPNIFIDLEKSNLSNRRMLDPSIVRLVIPKGQINSENGHDFLKVYTDSINEK